MPGIVRPDTYRSRAAFSFEDFESQARQIIQKAREAAAGILKRAETAARERARDIERQAHARGLEDGRREGRELARREAAEQARAEARRQYEQLGQTLAAGLAAFDESKRRLLAEAQREMIGLAVAIARRVCKHEVGRDTRTARENVRAALEMVRHEHDLEVHLHPAQYQALRETFPECTRDIVARDAVHLVEDETVTPGGCLVASRHGTIDARIETQIDRIARAILDPIGGPSGDDAAAEDQAERGPA